MKKSWKTLNIASRNFRNTDGQTEKRTLLQRCEDASKCPGNCYAVMFTNCLLIRCVKQLNGVGASMITGSLYLSIAHFRSRSGAAFGGHDDKSKSRRCHESRRFLLQSFFATAFYFRSVFNVRTSFLGYLVVLSVCLSICHVLLLGNRWIAVVQWAHQSL